MSHPLKYFTDEELTEIAEIARVALGDGDIFDKVAFSLDLSDEYLLNLRDKIEEVTNGAKENNDE